MLEIILKNLDFRMNVSIFVGEQSGIRSWGFFAYFEKSHSTMMKFQENLTTSEFVDETKKKHQNFIEFFTYYNSWETVLICSACWTFPVCL